MSDKTRQYIIILYATLFALVLAFGSFAYIYALMTKRFILDPALQNGLINFAVYVLGAGGAALVSWLNSRRLEEAKQQLTQTTQRIAETNQQVVEIKETLANGGGEGVKAIKEQVDKLVQQNERDPNSRERASDQPGPGAQTA